MAQAASTIIINAPGGTVWQVVSAFGSAGSFLVGVDDCSAEGEGIGAVRTLINCDGSRVVERLEMLEVPAQRLSYSLLTETPFRNCRTTIDVRDLGPVQAQVIWSATFDVDGLPVNEAVELLESALAANCLALQQYFE